MPGAGQGGVEKVAVTVGHIDADKELFSPSSSAGQ